jgi:hypothetical protein
MSFTILNALRRTSLQKAGCKISLNETAGMEIWFRP